MEIVKKYYKELIILLLVLVIALMRVFQPTSDVDMNEYIKIGSKEYLLLSKVQDTSYIEVTNTITEYVPKPYKVTEIIYTNLPQHIDTLAILKDYYSKYYYKDVIKVNEYGTGTITDVITQNKVLSREVLWNLDIPVITNTITVLEPPKTKIYFGGGLGIDKVNLINNVNGGFLLQTKRDKIYGIHTGLQFNNTVTPYINGSMYWKIKLKN